MDGDEHLKGDYGSDAENSRTKKSINDSLDKENKVEDENQCQNQTEDCVLQGEDEKLEITTGKDFHVGFEVTETVVMSEEVKAENGTLSIKDGSPNGSLEIDGRCAKRARITVDEHQPSVHFIYNSLTRASRQKLEELLQQWSEWHNKHVSLSNDPNEVLESGEQTFYPPLHVGLEKTSAVLFWMDNLTRNDKSKDFIPLNDNSVPLYDRGYALGLTSADGSSNVDGVMLHCI